MTLRPSLRRYGSTTLEEHYRKIAVEGQEYDPYTTLFASKKQREDYSADAASS
jgi:divinyl chlorophyllide a 8-vinyl-reductase